MPDADAEVLIVGAGPAGCAAAWDLLAAGRRVTLLDRCAFPRVKPCAGGLTVKTLCALRYPVAPVVRAVSYRFVAGLRHERALAMPSRTPLAALTVRAEFDAYCLDRCRAAGAAFEVIAPLREVAWDGRCWTVTTADRRITAPYLVAADGANSQVRHLLRLGSHIRYGMALECCVPPGQFPRQDLAFDFGVVPEGYGWVFPKGDHLNVGVYSMGKLDHAKTALDAYLARKLGLAPPDAYHGHRIPHHGHDFAPAADEARQLYFVGDAAGLVDPLLGEGIYHAVRSGQLAAAAIAAQAAGQTAPRYATLIHEITDDLRAYWRKTQWFYANVDRGYRLLTMPLARHVLIRGYALGLPAGRLQRQFLTLPFRTPPDLSRHLAAQRG